MTLAKVREIAVLKLIGAKNRIIASMILQQALALGVIGFFWSDASPPACGDRPFRNMCCCCRAMLWLASLS